MGSTASARLSRRLRARLATEGGFTLPELLITMAILLMVVASLASVLVAATNSGMANLAVFSSCIMINGGSSTSAFNPTGLFGSNWVLGSQAG